MKKNLIRSFAILITASLTLVSTSMFSGKVFGSNIIDPKNEWVLFSNGAKDFDVTEGLSVSVENAGVNLSESSAKKDDLALYVRFTINNEDALNSFKASGCIELAQDTYDKSELYWLLNDTNLNIGTNELTLYLKDANSQCIEDSDYFNIKKPINWFRIFSVTDAKTGQQLYTKTDVAKLNEVKLLDLRTAGLNFGDIRTKDTYLQLSKPLTQVPQTIEASVNPNFAVSKWNLGNVVGSLVNDNITVPEIGNEPGGDISYYKVAAHSDSKVKINTKLNINAERYTPDQLSLSFWYYNPDASQTKLSEGAHQIRISSSENGVSEKFLYYPMNSIAVSKGWNHIVLPLNTWPEFSHFIEDFSLSSIQSFGIVEGDTYYNNSDFDCYFTDFSLEVNSDWKLGNIVGDMVSDNSVVPENDKGPGNGITYYKVAAHNGSNVRINTRLNINAGKYTPDQLSLSFWYYNPDASQTKLSEGAHQIRISSSENSVSEKFLYYPMNSIAVSKGWNHIVLPLNTWPEFSHFIENFSLSSIQSFGIVEGDIYYNNSDFDCYFADFKLVINSNQSSGSVDIKVSDNVDANSLSDNYMIFSNSNNESENSVYALFLTQEGYPSLVYGSKQFTLTKPIQNGKWSDIAVVRNSDKTVSFYIDGVQIAKSTVKTDNISSFKVPHSIGADGKGSQIMSGMISDLRVWEDVRTSEEIASLRVEKKAGIITNGLNSDDQGLIGSWFLLGDIQYVLESMPDVSRYSNTAVYRGSRADDWSDYTIPPEIGDDYWSLVFVPDIQNLTNDDEYNETWKSMGQWIAENIDKENIKHVISAGDSTWGNNDEQYTRALKGFNKFNNLVSWSNMIGNHDYVWNLTERNSEKYHEYFAESQIKSSAAGETYCGYFEDPANKTTTENSYYRFAVNGKKWMIIQLEFHPRKSVLNWAKSIIESHSTDNVILTTHSYLDGYGGYSYNANMDYINEISDDASGGYIGDTTAEVWNTLKQCSNIKMILCGHSMNGTGAVVEKNEVNSEGVDVPVLMINAQDVDAGEGLRDGAAYYTNSPLGMLGIFRFSKDGSKVALQYYSPKFNKSFSPEFDGAANSNSLKFSFSVLSCSHINTTVMVNQNAATSKTNGYTGDLYCTDCQEFINYGKIIPALGGGNSSDDSDSKDNSQSADSESHIDSPSTGDYIKRGIYIAAVMVLISGATVITLNKIMKKERRN